MVSGHQMRTPDATRTGPPMPDPRPTPLARSGRSSWLADLRRDFPYAIRSLRRSLDFSLLALFTLAIGIGANAAIFSVVNAVLLRPLPYVEPDALVRVFEALKDKPAWTGAVSVPNLRDWRDQSKTFEQFVAYQVTGGNLEGGSEPERLVSVLASANLFTTLRVPPIAGRTFAPDDDQPGHNSVVVLSEALWRRRFAGDPAAVGRSIQLDGRPRVIIGVMPARFVFLRAEPRSTFGSRTRPTNSSRCAATTRRP
jgi:putative ABC transport system permease protein